MYGILNLLHGLRTLGITTVVPPSKLPGKWGGGGKIIAGKLKYGIFGIADCDPHHF